MIVKDASYGGYVLAPLNGFGYEGEEYVANLVNTGIDTAGGGGGVSTSDPISPDNAAGTGSVDSGGGLLDTAGSLFNQGMSYAEKAAAAAAEALRLKQQAEALMGGSGGATGIQTPPGGSTPVVAFPAPPRMAIPGGGGIALSDPEYVKQLSRKAVGARKLSPAALAAARAVIPSAADQMKEVEITKTPYGQPSSISLPKVGLGVALGYFLFFR